MPDEKFLELPERPGSENPRAMRAYRAMVEASTTTTTTTATTTTGMKKTKREESGKDATTVLAAMAVMPSDEVIARRRRARLDPWTARALAEDPEEERRKGTTTTSKGKDKGGGKSTTTKISDERRRRLLEVAQNALGTVTESLRLRAEESQKFTERRNFAGKMVEVETEYVEGSKEAKAHDKKVEMLARGGIDAILAELMAPKKLTVMDKTKADWRTVKQTDEELEEDLQAHRRGGQTFREQQDFLQQADYREYELERDARLAASSKRAAPK
jgi:hypothetical protein